jgi:hypothetical protein
MTCRRSEIHRAQTRKIFRRSVARVPGFWRFLLVGLDQGYSSSWARGRKDMTGVAQASLVSRISVKRGEKRLCVFFLVPSPTRRTTGNSASSCLTTHRFPTASFSIPLSLRLKNSNQPFGIGCRASEATSITAPVSVSIPSGASTNMGGSPESRDACDTRFIDDKVSDADTQGAGNFRQSVEVYRDLSRFPLMQVPRRGAEFSGKLVEGHFAPFAPEPNSLIQDIFHTQYRNHSPDFRQSHGKMPVYDHLS